MFKKIQNSGSSFIGRQLSRFKMSMAYVALAMSSTTAAMTIAIRFPDFPWYWILILSPALIFLAIMFGYYLDRLNISTQDQRKSNEMTHRYLLTSDFKSQEFHLTQTKMLLTAIAKYQKKEEIDVDEIMQMYQEYQRKWSSPQ